MSIARQLWLTTSATLLLLGTVLCLLLGAIRASGDADQARRLSFRRISDLELALASLREAESGQRGFLLTGRDYYLQPFNLAMTTLPGRLDRVRADEASDPALKSDVDRLRELINAKIVELKETIQLRRTGGLPAALRIVETDRGWGLMQESRHIVDRLEANLRVAAEQRDAAAARAYRRLLATLIIGGLGIAAASITINIWVISSISRQHDALTNGVRRIAAGDLSTEIPKLDRSGFARLATAFNEMIHDLRDERARRQAAEAALSDSNRALLRHAQGLKQRRESVEVLSRLASRLTGCEDESDLAQVVQRFGPTLAPGGAGALYTHIGAVDGLRRVAEWSSPSRAPEAFDPAECWGMRRGQPHIVDAPDPHTACAHVGCDGSVAHRCFPLIAHGETVGLLYLEERDVDLALPVADLSVVAETIAAALANLRLRETLLEMSIRDPLTGLFNRRRLQEALSPEMARSVRSGAPLTLVILDLDNFKACNDTWGHEAGDLVLKAVGAALQQTVRRGDLACRYGGEEFMLMLPDTDAGAGSALAERVRRAVEALKVTHLGRGIGDLSASLGVATFPDAGETAEAVIQAADRALYRAKRAGKNRVASAHPCACSRVA